MALQSMKQRTFRWVLIFLVLCFCVVDLFPIYALVVSSLKPSAYLMRYGISFESIKLSNFTLTNYRNAATASDSIFPRWFANTVFLTILDTGISVVLSSMVGYGLAIYSFKGRRAVIILLLLVMILPQQILILPLYKLIVAFGLINTIAGIIAPFAVYPITILFFRQYAQSLPKDFVDAGRMDGLSEIGIYLKVMTPLMMPAFGAMAILHALKSWNSYLWPLIVLRTMDKFTISIGLNSLLSPEEGRYDILISGAVVATVPMIVFFLFMQRYFITGLTAGGIKA